MIKATALKLVTAENRDLVADVLTKRKQRILSRDCLKRGEMN